MIHWFQRLILISSATLAWQSAATPLISMHFPAGVAVHDLAHYLAHADGRNLVIGSNLRSEVYIFAPQPVSLTTAWELFESALASHGLTLLASGPVSKIVSTQKAGEGIPPPYSSSQLTQSSDNPKISYLYHHSRGNPGKLEPVLLRLLRPGSMRPLGTTALILTGTRREVLRAVEILRHLEKGESEATRIEFLTLGQPNAERLAALLRAILATPKSHALVGAKLWVASPDTLIFAASEADIQLLTATARRLDTALGKSDDDTAKIRVYPVMFHDGPTLAAAIAQLQNGPKHKRAAAVQFDSASSTLIVSGSQLFHDAVRRLLTQLDLPPRNVLIELHVFQLQQDLAEHLRTSLLAGTSGNGATTSVLATDSGPLTPLAAGEVAAATGGLSSDTTAPALEGLSHGLSVGVLSPTPVDIPGIGKLSPRALIGALRHTNAAEQLTAPQLVTRERSEAELSVGTTVFFSSQNLGTPNDAELKREQVDWSVKLRPGMIRGGGTHVEIDLKAHDIVGWSAQTGAPKLAQRSLRSAVWVAKDQAFLLGGFHALHQQRRVIAPTLLGHLPLLGPLLSRRQFENKVDQIWIFASIHTLTDAQTDQTTATATAF